MKNLHLKYSSMERQPKVLPELSQLLPPLSAEQLEALETDLLQNGCYSPIVVNEDLVIVDGHNRQRLCEQHGIPYQMAVFSFDDLLEAKQWALDTQKGRRNLEKWELGKIALKLKPEVEARAKANQGSRTDILTTLSESSAPVSTRKQLADTVGIGEVTMGKVIQIDEYAPSPIKEALDKQEISIHQGYNLTQQMQKLPEDQRERAAAEALDKMHRGIKQMDAEIDRRTAISVQFCKAFEKAIQLVPSEENVRIWTECCRMTLEEMADTADEARDLAVSFTTIADLLEHTIMPEDWRCAHGEKAPAVQ
jgi:hypothetical protein